jgi:ATP-dependent Clp protease ATP-binding subunit ClpA
LDKEEIKKIVEIQMRYLQDRLIEKKISITFSDMIKNLIADKGFDPIFGARPIKRTIQQMIENPLSMKILNGEFGENDTIKIDVKDGALIFKK